MSKICPNCKRYEKQIDMDTIDEYYVCINCGLKLKMEKEEIFTILEQD